ncbi:MAG: hypothetical protein AB3N17_12430, partial [Tateyamaria sp.]
SDLGIGGWSPRHAMAGLVAHLVRMTTHCATQFDRFRQYGGLTLDADERDYIAGFSVFPSLNLPIQSHADLVRIANDIGRDQGLFLNPSVIFGGTTETWDTLFPGEARVRVNLSMPATGFADGLGRLSDRVADTQRIRRHA